MTRNTTTAAQIMTARILIVEDDIAACSS